MLDDDGPSSGMRDLESRDIFTRRGAWALAHTSKAQSAPRSQPHSPPDPPRCTQYAPSSSRFNHPHLHPMQTDRSPVRSPSCGRPTRVNVSRVST
jgi:hypothetical protein